MLRRDDCVYIKVIGINDGKISLAMKEVDQVTGKDLNPRHTEELRTGITSEFQEPREGSRRQNPTRPHELGDRGYKNLTGLKHAKPNPSA